MNNTIMFLKKEFSNYYKNVKFDLPDRFTRREWGFLYLGETFMQRHLAFRKTSDLRQFLSGHLSGSNRKNHHIQNSNIPAHVYSELRLCDYCILAHHQDCTVPSYQAELQVYEEDAAAAAEDYRAERKIQRRPAAYPERDNEALPDLRHKPGRRLPADAASDAYSLCALYIL